MTMINTLLISILTGIVITWIFEFTLRTNKNFHKKYYEQNNIIFGYHVHHSNYGIALFVSSLITFFLNYKSASLFLFGIGMGIIIMHTISEKKFVFIDKQRNK